MRDAWSRYESVVDQQIRMAQERGDFDDLPGTGKPLPGWGSPDDEDWWLKAYLRREGLPAEAMLPTSFQLAREVEKVPETVADLRSEQAVRDAVGALNERVAAYLRAPSTPYVRVAPVDADQVVAQWRAQWRAQWQQAPTVAPSTKEPRPRRFRLRRRAP